MRFINKGSLSIYLLIGFLLRFLFPSSFRDIYFCVFLMLTSGVLGVLISKYKCVNVIAGIDSTTENVEIAAKHVGRLMFFIAFLLALATILSFVIDDLFGSWYILFFAGPIVVYTLYCIVKINKE